MTTKNKHKKQAVRKVLMGLVAAVCLILSSCIIKSQLKSLLGQASSTAMSAKAAKESKKNITSFQTNACVIDAPANLWSADSASVLASFNGLSGGLTLFIASAFLLLLTGAVISRLSTRQVFYVNRNLRLAALPLFISHRRLLI